MIKKAGVNEAKLIVKPVSKPVIKTPVKPVIKSVVKPVMKPEKEVKEKKISQGEINQALINNFISLQKVLTNLSFRFDDLSNNISKLLQLFEISAKSFTEKYPKQNIEEKEKTDKEFLKRLDSLMDQNKTIARGIMLMEEQIRHRDESEFEEEKSEAEMKPVGAEVFKSKPLPR